MIEYGIRNIPADKIVERNFTSEEAAWAIMNGYIFQTHPETGEPQYEIVWREVSDWKTT